MEKSVKIFISYAGSDRPMLEMLEKHLNPIQQAYGTRLIVWSDRSIQPGQFWDEEIRKHLHSADIYLMLTSVDSLLSDYVAGIEIPTAIERSKKGEAILIPIILQACPWMLSGLAKFMALPKNGMPVSTYPNPDLAFIEIVKELSTLLESRIGKPIKMPEKRQAKPIPIDSIERKIAEGNLQEAIEEFIQRAKMNGYDDEYHEGLLLLARLSRLKKDRLSGIMPFDEISRYVNHISASLLELNRASRRVVAA